MRDRKQVIERTNLSSLARRDFMVGGAGVCALGLISTQPAAALPMPGTAEVYAFRAPDSRDFVFAVAFPVAGNYDPKAAFPAVRIHFGSKFWTINSDNAEAMKWPPRERGFVGRAVKSSPTSNDLYHLVVISTPSVHQSGNCGVWAEISNNVGARLRVGNPITSEILSRNASLARAFQKGDPSSDREFFSEALTEQILAREPSAAKLERCSHAERLAASLLPDVLPFNPSQAIGFTFAGRNGRLPTDAAGNIVDSVLTGVPVRRPATAVFGLSQAFPYFATHTAA